MQGIDTNTIKLDRPGDCKRVHAIFRLKLPANTARFWKYVTLVSIVGADCAAVGAGEDGEGVGVSPKTRIKNLIRVFVDNLKVSNPPKNDRPCGTQERSGNVITQLNSSMTTSEPSRLDRIERILDTLAVNQVNERDRRLNLQEEIDLLEQKQRISDERMSRVEASQERFDEQMVQSNDRMSRIEASHDRFNERMEQLTAAQQRNQQQIDQLTSDIGNLAIQVEGISTQAQQDRSQAAIDRAEFRSTVQGILDALRQQYNGNGGRGN